MSHISTKSRFCKTFKNGMPKSKENTSTPRQKKKDFSSLLQTAKQKNSKLSRMSLIELPERKKKQDRSVKKKRVATIDHKKRILWHKMMEIKQIQLTVVTHLQMVLPPSRMPNQTKKMQMKYLKLISYIKNSLLSLRLTKQTLKMSLSLWILS